MTQNRIGKRVTKNKGYGIATYAIVMPCSPIPPESPPLRLKRRVPERGSWLGCRPPPLPGTSTTCLPTQSWSAGHSWATPWGGWGKRWYILLWSLGRRCLLCPPKSFSLSQGRRRAERGQVGHVLIGKKGWQGDVWHFSSWEGEKK